VSYEADALLELKKPVTESVSTVVVKVIPVTENVDMVAETKKPKPSSHDILLEHKVSKGQPTRIALEGGKEVSQSIDFVNSIDVSLPTPTTIKMFAIPKRYYQVDAPLETSFILRPQVDIFLAKDRILERLSKMARINPQFEDLNVPFLPSLPYNSEQETL
jgi:hypothetical protein